MYALYAGAVEIFSLVSECFYNGDVEHVARKAARCVINAFVVVYEILTGVSPDGAVDVYVY